MKWKKVNLCENQIKARTAKSVLVKMPLSSKYKGFFFLHPSKLVKTSYYRGKSYELLYTDDFTFNLFKNGKGKTNKYEKIAEKCIDVEDFEEAFKVVEDDFDEYTDFIKSSYYEVEEPKKIEIDDIEIPKELMKWLQ